MEPQQQAVEEQLLGLLDELREQADSAQGYGPANLIALLRLAPWESQRSGSLASLHSWGVSARHRDARCLALYA